MSFDGQFLDGHTRPARCDVCRSAPTEWSYYHRKSKQTLAFCSECVPPPGTPRYTKLKFLGRAPHAEIPDPLPARARWAGAVAEVLGRSVNGNEVMVHFAVNDMRVAIPYAYLEPLHPLEQLALAEEDE